MRIGHDSAWAKTLGSALAHVQHGIDRLCGWGFERMKKAGSDTVIDVGGNPHLAKAKRFGKAALRFLGTLGDSYFKEYGKLKKHRH